ncbi:MAG: YfiR family protein [Candidatus Thiodiazotropha lotti]|nr:YfiR family protein [Candidatus Thiodiazotropha lotti]MCG8005112.1 YfiR family protein [Candidatus Thiodiazotropha lotti]MCG8006357.1 YfiR family protein [Candidatus Thiodiazotropha lotti]MCW4188740.1 YfiR family protein [Candidatus Thiodiazotropha lotti]MCW4193938.1 YfiR family protein [Candidatus Thiodiazotropha lotti]
MATRLLTYITIVVFSLSTMTISAAQDSEQEAALLKTVFIYNFAKFTRWPDSQSKTVQDTLTLCSIGDDNITKNLPKLAGRVLRGKPIKIVKISDESILSNCHLLYLAESTQNRIREVLQSIKMQPVLTISEMDQFSQMGGMIELTQDWDKLRFIINLNTTRSAGLRLSSRLLDLATIIDDEAK